MRIERLLCLFFAFTSCIPAFGQDESSVKAVFSKFTTATMYPNGYKVRETLDSSTLNYYKEINYLIKNADSVQIDSLDLYSKILILSNRHFQLTDAYPEHDSIVTFLIDLPTYQFFGVGGIEISEIEFEGNCANAKMTDVLDENSSNSQYLLFIKENGDWKLNLTTWHDTSGSMFESMKESYELSEKEFLMLFIGNLAQKQVQTNDIWHPIDNAK